MDGIPDKWRPPLWLILGGTLAVTAVLPVLAFVALRYLVPEFGWRISVTIASLSVVAMTLALAWVLVRGLLGPISAVSAWARAVEGRVAPDDAGPVARYGSRELADLARSVRAMGVG
ncbi:MAG: sensor histidine kinase, partial [Shimia sp.]